MDYQTLNYEFSENVATITLNRRDNSANALNAQMTEELLDVSVKCGAPEVRAVIFTAIGKMFCVPVSPNPFIIETVLEIGLV